MRSASAQHRGMLAAVFGIVFLVFFALSPLRWVEFGMPNNGLLLKLADGQEDFFVSGPRVPSSEFADPAHRPALEVTYLPP